MQEAGIRLSTEMFFESVPDEYVDVSLDKWHFDEDARVIPIIIPRNYLNLYNFGFAQSRSLPKLSEGLMSLVQMDVMMRGNGRVEQYKGNIVGFSNRLNTILVPQSFMDWANKNFAPEKEAEPSRLIVEVKILPTQPSPTISSKRITKLKATIWMREDNLFPAPHYGHRHGSRIVHQHSVILHPDAEHLPASPKEYGKTGKPAADRI